MKWAPRDLAGPAFDEAMASLPIAFLESYPLPAFVCCVRTGRVRKEAYAAAADRPERPHLSHNDTNGTIVGSGSRRARSMGQHSGSSSTTGGSSQGLPTATATPSPTPTPTGELYRWSANVASSHSPANGSYPLPPPSLGSYTNGPMSQTSTAASSASMSRSASRNTTTSGALWNWRPPIRDAYDTDEEDERDDDVLPLHSVSSSSSRLGTRGGSPFAAMSTFTYDQPHGSTSCVWYNPQWSKVAGDLPLAAIVDPTTFAALEGWVESNIETRNNNSRVSRDSAQFSLDVQGTNLQLVKTRHDKHPPNTVLWIITCTKLTERAYGGSEQGSSEHDYGHPMIAHLAKSLGADDPHSCVKLMETIDWSKKSIGPRSKWASEINAMVSLVLITVPPVALWISDDLIGVYNQAYAEFSDHPQAFGKSMRELWDVAWDEVEPLVNKALAGEPAEREKGLIFYQRNERGRHIEKHHSFSFHPIFDKTGKVLGIWNPTHDHTDTVLAERRLKTTTKLVEETSFARTPQEMYQMTAEVMSQNPTDAPFVMLYSVKVAGSAASSAASTEGGSLDLDLQLESSVGVPGGHPSAIEKIQITGLSIASASGSFTEECLAERMGSVVVDKATDPGGSHLVAVDMTRMASPTTSVVGSVYSRGSGHSRGSTHSSRRRLSISFDSSFWPIRKALETRQCVLVDNIQNLINGFPIRQWDELPDQAIVVPINNDPENKVPQAVMVLGLNLRRPFDGPYEDWVNMLRGYLSATLAAVTTFEEDMRLRLEKEKLERAKSAWFRGAAHEFRTPLTLIAGPLEDILQTKLNSSQRQQLQMVRRNITRLEQLMTSLLDLTRLESGKVEARFVPTDLADFITDLARVFRPAFEKHKIRFCVETEAHDAVAVDPVLVEIVVAHLVINALKLTENGTVSIRLAFTHDMASIIVSDTGTGMSETDMQSATNFFHRIQTAENRGTAATGVGLAIIKEIVRLHNGKLTIRTKTAASPGEDSGSTFTVSFPLSNEPNVDSLVTVPFGVYAKQVASDIKEWSKGGDTPSEDSLLYDGRTSVPSGRSASETSGSLTSAGFTDGLMFEREDVLLVVDNNAEMREYIKTLFERFCTVVEAASAEEACELIKTVEPNLVISELVMHSMSGIELLHEMRLVDRLRFVPMVLISSTTDDEQRVAAFLAGVDDFVSKPFKPRELLLRAHLHMQMGKKRNKLERLFAQREQELSVLSDYCPSGIMRTDADGKVLYANASFRNPAGMMSDEDPHQWFEFCDDESRGRVEHAWFEILQGRLPATTLQWKWRTGRTMSAVLIRLDVVRPGMSGLLMCVTDISYQEERLEEAQRRRIEAEESKHQQELLVDLTSHEIRTPVSAILQCSSLVKENLVALKEQLRFAGDAGFKPTPSLLADLEEDVEALESIYQCGLVQERIAGDVLSLARIQLDMLSLHFVEMDLHKEAKKVLSVFANEAKMKKIEILLELGGSLEALQVRGIKTDPVRLGQVLTNLTANAIRFTAAAETRRITVHYEVALEPPLPGTLLPPPNMPHPMVTPLAEDTPIYLYVSVTDTGPGMTPEEQKMLFRRFQQSNKMIHTRYGGSGLGLFICKKIVELLGGAIAVESEIGVGSVFRFWIKTHTVAPVQLGSPTVAPSPLAIPPTQTLRVGAPDPAVSPLLPVPRLPATTPASPDAPEPLRLLIVEDNIINQTVLKRQLVKAGFVCDTANDGQEALLRIHEVDRECRHGSPGAQGYDAVLMDLEMPVMDGLTAIRHIRDAERRGILRPQLVIALTGNARQGQIDQAKAAGMNDVVIKPYRLPALIAKIRDASQSHRARCADDGCEEVRAAPRLRYDTNAAGHAVLSEANVARLGSKRRVQPQEQRGHTEGQGEAKNANGRSPDVPSAAADMARDMTDASE
ncbi:hypothetical protein CC85DRAFT_260792 [Cutaneotrichosporon oleaginosum]|uniref:Uncharacterized protein n=1 Tax=Cutaneotrichosporon oleaginosum TaxID=879819 RepID=A0A0J0XM60_9TREE|nr:uncharacterized protein CC85DRAFT_260792 [Cutaneotrichosporon oleaginosum]KLT42200.1 hypothetical protein CC85DRAFT_260792 [Cutaneotrichosporon oleaginosum]TXT11681.1 hypothetical protein COLE_02091 [Cutaneotrichosporon oleaginosum]